MGRVLENVLRRARLHQMAQMQHADRVGNIAHHGKVMGNEQNGAARFLLNVFEQVDHLRLNGNVQRTDGLVGNNELRPHNQGPGDAHALTLAAGQLVRIAVGVFDGQPYFFEHGIDHFLPFRLGGGHVMDVNAFGDDVHHFFARIQRRHGILKDHLHFLAQHGLLLLGQVAGNILAPEDDPACRGLVQTDDRPARGGFAAAAFTHQTVDFALVDGEGYVVHRLDRKTAADGKILL